jgi:small subunit ribosomal protein S12
MMNSLKQLTKRKVVDFEYLTKQSKKLKRNPQRKAVCINALTISPKKPNSANRRVVKARITGSNSYIAKVPGEQHNIQQHSVVLLQGSRARDLIGVYLRTIRGKYDLFGVKNRKTSRSLYGVKKT